MNVPDAQGQKRTYKGMIGGIECINHAFDGKEMNQLRKFYKHFKEFVSALVLDIKTEHPDIDFRIR